MLDTGLDETYVKVASRWRYVYRAVDQYGQIIDVLVSARRDLRAGRGRNRPRPNMRAAIEGLMPAAFHNTDQYANNRGECDHGRRALTGVSRPHSRNSPKRSEPETGQRFGSPRPDPNQRNSAMRTICLSWIATSSTPRSTRRSRLHDGTVA